MTSRRSSLFREEYVDITAKLRVPLVWGNFQCRIGGQKYVSLDLFYRDPYVLDFLGLNDTYSEKDLENAILSKLERFILEMGTDFAFMARQKHFVLDGRDYYMDLLFFHRTLRRRGLRYKVTEVRPNIDTHPEFGEALEEAKATGVHVIFLGCDVQPSSLTIDESRVSIW